MASELNAIVCPNECDGGQAQNVIGIEVSELYDGILFWHCAQCGARWHRWPEGTSQRIAAEPYLVDFKFALAESRPSLKEGSE